MGATATLQAQQLPQTWQEEMKFRAGPTPYEPLMKFWRELDEASEIVSMQPLTRTLQGRDLPLIIIAEPAITNPQDALRSGKTIVLLAPSVHGGEVSPKESVQLVARELVGGSLRPLLKDIIVIALPLVNPDGGEVRRRTNEAGFDMNRDYLKLESQEITALVTRVMNQWTPDIHVDGHHGGSAPYVITYQGTLNPAADSALRMYPYEHIFPAIREAVRAEDYASFDYSGTLTRDGVLGWGSTSVEPRKHHVYTGLTNSIGILLENCAGALPAWLSPLQVMVLSITDSQADYAESVAQGLKKQGFRVDSDLRGDKIGYKIREHSLQKIPYLVVVGEKEKQAGQVAVRARGGKDLGVMTPEALAQIIRADVAAKGLAEAG